MAMTRILPPATAFLGATCARLLPLHSRIAIAGSSCLFHSSLSNVSFSPLQPTKALPQKRFQVRAARTESKGVSLGFRAPEFELPEPLTGKTWKLDDFESYPALLKGLAVVAISSNSVVTHPQDGPEFMAEEAKFFKYPFPYLYDESQEVARAFGAVCTPEFLLFKKEGRRPFELFYHGQFDDSRPSNNVTITGRDLSIAIDCALSGQTLSSKQKPSVGCSIKWHPEKSQ